MAILHGSEVDDVCLGAHLDSGFQSLDVVGVEGCIDGKAVAVEGEAFGIYGDGAFFAGLQRSVGDVERHIIIYTRTHDAHACGLGGHVVGQRHVELHDCHFALEGERQRLGGVGVVGTGGEEHVVGSGATFASELAGLEVQVVDDGVGLVIHIGVLGVGVDGGGGGYVAVEVTLEVGVALVASLIAYKFEGTTVGVHTCIGVDADEVGLFPLGGEGAAILGITYAGGGYLAGGDIEVVARLVAGCHLFLYVAATCHQGSCEQ